jgi:DNA-binding Xre family transcriptional regulator
MKIKACKYKDLLKKELKNADFRREYEALEDEFIIAKEIINLRRIKKYTQKDLAEKAGTSQPAIARIESGNYRNVSLSFLKRIASALDAVPEIHLKRKTS